MKNTLFTLALLVSFSSFGQRKTGLPSPYITIILENDTILSGDTISIAKLLNSKLYFNLEVKDDSIYYIGRDSITGIEAKKALQRENIYHIQMEFWGKNDALRELQEKYLAEQKEKYLVDPSVNLIDYDLEPYEDEPYYNNMLLVEEVPYYNIPFGVVKGNLENWKDQLEDLYRFEKNTLILPITGMRITSVRISSKTLPLKVFFPLARKSEKELKDWWDELPMSTREYYLKRRRRGETEEQLYKRGADKFPCVLYIKE